MKKSSLNPTSQWLRIMKSSRATNTYQQTFGTNRQVDKHKTCVLLLIFVKKFTLRGMQSFYFLSAEKNKRYWYRKRYDLVPYWTRQYLQSRNDITMHCGTSSWKLLDSVLASIDRTKNMATGTVTNNVLCRKLWNAHKLARKRSNDSKSTTHNVVSTGMNFPEIYDHIWLSSCLLAVLGSQGIVVKCTVAIFFGLVRSNCKASAFCWCSPTSPGECVGEERM